MGRSKPSSSASKSSDIPTSSISGSSSNFVLSKETGHGVKIKEMLAELKVLIDNVAWLLGIIHKIADLRVFEDKTPNHVLINKYTPGQGIMPHEDGPLYYPTVSNVTLGSHGVLDFYRTINELNSNRQGNEKDSNAVSQRCSLEERYVGSLLLERRSLFLMQDDMYTSYLHGIKERTVDSVDENILNLEQCKVKHGDILERAARISFTIRHVPKVLKTKIFLSSKKR